MSSVIAWSENRRLVGLTLLLVVILVYLPGILGGAFHFDDVDTPNSGRSFGSKHRQKLFRKNSDVYVEREERGS